jgi:hypothetical protein
MRRLLSLVVVGLALYREPRSWAVVYVDAMTGNVLRRTFCDRPCKR